MNAVRLLLAMFSEFEPEIVYDSSDHPTAMIIKIPLNKLPETMYDADEPKAV